MSLALEPAQLAAFAAASVILVGMPGPNTIYITTRSLAHGTRAGVVSVLGVETGTAVYAAALSTLSRATTRAAAGASSSSPPRTGPHTTRRAASSSPSSAS